MKISHLVNRARLSLRRRVPFLRRPRHWYDMVTDPGEQYYLEQYWHWMSSHALRSGSFLDVGCGYGRVALRLAEWCSANGSVLGIDNDNPKIVQARRYAADRKLSNLKFETADILPFLRDCPKAYYDAVLFLEVAFFYPDFAAAISEIRRALKPQGLLFASFRPLYFNLLYSLRQGFWEDAGKLLRERQGNLWGGEKCMTWQTSAEIRGLLADQGFEVLKLVGIGCCSGTMGDPLLEVANPKELGPRERQQLLSTEIALGESMPDCGRYILAIAISKAPLNESQG